MARKIARPTDSAGKVMWKAAVVANCQRDRSMKVCDDITLPFLRSDFHNGACGAVFLPGKQPFPVPASRNKDRPPAGGCQLPGKFRALVRIRITGRKRSRSAIF